MIPLKIFLVVFFISPSLAVINKNDKREIHFEKYGPPPVPQKVYGVPQHVPFREYGPPPSKLNFGSTYGGGYKHNKIHEQIIKVFTGPKGAYSLPNQKPTNNYGPPQIKPFRNYGPPPKISKIIHGPPPKPHYGPPLKPIYGLPKPTPVYGPPALPHLQQLPHTNSLAISHQQYTPTNHIALPHPAPVYEPPSTSYGVPETTIIVNGNQQGGGIESLPTSETQSVHFGHAGCDGWKPISAPVGHQVDYNGISEGTGYSNAPVNEVTDVITSSILPQQNILPEPGVPGDQSIAIALQSGSTGENSLFNGQEGQNHGAVFSGETATVLNHHHQIQVELQPNIVHQELPQPIPAQNFHVQQQINLANLVSTDDSYSRPPPDSYAPNSIHALKYEKHNYAQGNHHSTSFGPRPSGNPYNNIHTETFTQQLPLIQPQQAINFRPPVPPGLIENIAAVVEHADNFGVNQQQYRLNTYIPPHINEIPQPQHQHFEQQRQQFEIRNHQQFESQQQPDVQNINTHNCGHGPNLATGNYQIASQQSTGYNNIVTGGYSIGEQQQIIQQPGTSYGPPPSGNVIDQQVSIQKPADNYGPPPSNNIYDVAALESRQSSVIASLPGLDGLNVLSAEKSEGVQISDIDNQGQGNEKFEIHTEFEESNKSDNVVPEDLIQKILTTVEGKPKKKAQNRSDNDVKIEEQIQPNGKPYATENKKDE